MNIFEENIFNNEVYRTNWQKERNKIEIEIVDDAND